MRLTALALAGLLWCCASPALAAPGDLDTSFGHAGLLHTDIGGTDFGSAIGLQRDGRLVVAGYADLAPPSDGRMEPGKLDFAVARYTARGRLDRTFAGRGFTTLGLGGQETVSALEVDPYATVVGGESRLLDPARYSTYGMFALARFDSKGRPDAGFGEDGWVTLRQTAASSASVALVHRLQYGELVAVGPVLPFDDTHTKLAFVHLYDDGLPDQNFAPLGTKIVDFNGNDGWPRAYLLDSRGGVLVAGVAAADFDGNYPVVVQRFSLEGVPDLGFGTNGVAKVGSTRGSAGPMALQRDASVIVSFGGDRWDKGRLVRISAAGVLDGRFGRNGTVDTVAPTDMAVDRADRIVVGGQGLQLARYGPNGAPDRRFRAVSVPRAYRGYGTAIALAPDGDIVAAGGRIASFDDESFAPPALDFAVARFHGGNDATPPRIAVRAGSGGCLRGALHLRIRDNSGHFSLVVSVDGRRVLQTGRSRALLRLPAGPHRVVVRARDSSDNVAVKRLRVTRCS